MNQLISHIEFLLHEHNCVIVPGLGGFVVNTISSHKDGVSVFDAPSCELVFNRDLAHNDGLLAQSYMKAERITFEAATRKIEQSVQQLVKQLREQRYVELGKLGVFTMNDEKRFMYTPAQFVRPSLFGLNKAVLKPLIHMQPALPLKPEVRKTRLRTIGISAAAAAAIALLVFMLPVSDNTIHRQTAQIISESGWFRSAQTPSATVTPVSQEDTAISVQMPTAESVGEDDGRSGVTAVVVKEQQTDISPKFYIVVGVYERQSGAEKILAALKTEGFSQAAKLERPGRTDVYAAWFSDKTQAETYLREFHKKHPVYSDAWVMKR